MPRETHNWYKRRPNRGKKNSSVIGWRIDSVFPRATGLGSVVMDYFVVKNHLSVSRQLCLTLQLVTVACHVFSAKEHTGVGLLPVFFGRQISPLTPRSSKESYENLVINLKIPRRLSTELFVCHTPWSPVVRHTERSEMAPPPRSVLLPENPMRQGYSP